MFTSIAGRAVVVTGGTRGIGKGIASVLASADEATILEVEQGAPLMAITRTTADGDGEPIEFSRDLFRADRTRIVVRTEGETTRTLPGAARVVELRAQAAWR